MLWVSDDPPPADVGQYVRAHEVRRLLGSSFDVVVLDFHKQLNPDLLGQVEGLIWGGGCLILRVDSDRSEPMWRRIEREFDAGVIGQTVQRGWRVVSGSQEQMRLVGSLAERWESRASVSVLLADRGRGKSSSLGLALHEYLDRNERATADDVIITGPSELATAEVLHFSGRASLRFTSLMSLLSSPSAHPPRLIVVDEAAQLPIALLKRLVARFPTTHLIFATTVRGYEGTGRGFGLRFVAWLKTQTAVAEYTLEQPIRWHAGDPLETAVRRALLLDAMGPNIPDGLVPARAEAVRLSRSELAQDEKTLAQLFALLTEAHYRTTPKDLQAILDGTVAVHAMVVDGCILAATLVAEEGELSSADCDDLYWGRRRIKAHALAETLVAHSGVPQAGEMKIVRSVRIATLARYRRSGLATRLIDHIHQTYKPDLFGTMFGATPELIRFRQQAGYALVRIGATSGARSGQPTAVMLRAVSPSGHRLLRQLQAEFSGDLTVQIELSVADRTLLQDDPLCRLLGELQRDRPLADTRRNEIVKAYAFGGRTQFAAARALQEYISTVDLSTIDPLAQTLLRGRIVERRGWAELRGIAGLPSVSSTMRAMRRAVRTAVEADLK